MHTTGRHGTRTLAITIALALAAGCAQPATTQADAATDAPPAARGGESAQVVLTDANLGAYALALEKQLEILQRPGRGTHYGVRVSRYGDGESTEVLDASGMTAEEYLAVHETVDPVFQLLNFQGEIGPPRSIDLDRVDPDYRARLEGDAFASLSPESAATLRRNMDVLVPLWSQITGLTAQHG